MKCHHAIHGAHRATFLKVAIAIIGDAKADANDVLFGFPKFSLRKHSQAIGDRAASVVRGTSGVHEPRFELITLA